MKTVDISEEFEAKLILKDDIVSFDVDDGDHQAYVQFTKDEALLIAREILKHYKEQK